MGGQLRETIQALVRFAPSSVEALCSINNGFLHIVVWAALANTGILYSQLLVKKECPHLGSIFENSEGGDCGFSSLSPICTLKPSTGVHEMESINAHGYHTVNEIKQSSSAYKGCLGRGVTELRAIAGILVSQPASPSYMYYSVSLLLDVDSRYQPIFSFSWYFL